ncbi:MAG: YifB family Mg chelatase-like AAA ATPase, partial [Methylococcales bacterium]|nr:YifB family Mg chelatase-like AAA ATPase [Methylococcales bacterium]
PADLPKEGGRYDLAIALGILAASGQIPKNALAEHECVGELSLSGEIRPINGVLPVVLACRDQGRRLLLPYANHAEAALIESAELCAAQHLLEVCAYLNGQAALPTPSHPTPTKTREWPDFADVKGQFQTKRALEIAAAGQHNLLMLGPPGTGKSMLAARLPSILPPLTENQALESAAIASISDRGFNVEQWRKPPFRAPHHTASAAALVGGGSNPRPGEISLAHHGALFLDELPEFDRKVLEVLREPLETGQITISRAARQAEFPAQFQLIAAMNPCPCGYLGDPSGRCHCSSEQVMRYRNRISGPLLDRIDLHLLVPRVELSELIQAAPPSEPSAVIRTRVSAARQLALTRQGKANAWLTVKEIDRFCRLDAAGEQLLQQAMTRLSLSHRAFHRILKVARTVADLAGAADLAPRHLGEAINLRRLDRAS